MRRRVSVSASVMVSGLMLVSALVLVPGLVFGLVCVCVCVCVRASAYVCEEGELLALEQSPDPGYGAVAIPEMSE